MSTTVDRATLDRVRDYFTTESLGDTQSLTPEGFLLCRNVPIARTGSQIYGPGEIPVEPGADGLVNITRDEAEVFRPDTIASFNGKPIVDEHPREGKVTPLLWRQKSVGVVLNPRRGDGLQYDNAFMYADLLVQDQAAIDAVRDGKREVSAGYDAEYLQTAPGQGRQRNIVGNHVALVDKGRCGPRCAIGDEQDMASRVRMFKDRIRRAVTKDEVLSAVTELSKDPELMGEVLSGDDDTPLESGPDNAKHHVTINVHGGKASEEKPDLPNGNGNGNGGDPPAVSNSNGPANGGEGDRVAALEARLDQVEQVLAMLAGEDEGGEGGGEQPGSEQPNGDRRFADEGNGDDDDKSSGDRAHTGDRRAMVGDSSSMRDGFQRMLSQAEILMPGIQLITFDAASPARTTFDAMCNFRRRTLEASKGTDKGKAAIEQVMDGKLPKSFHDASMTCDTIGTVFTGASSLIAQQNAGRATQPHFGANGERNGFSTKTPTPADINKRMRDFYAGAAR
jgi:hypothetical protein